MRRSRRALLLALIGLGGVAAARAGGAPAITKLEARSLPPRLVVARLFEQMRELVLPPFEPKARGALEPWTAKQIAEARQAFVRIASFDRRAPEEQDPSDAEVREALERLRETLRLRPDKNATPHPRAALRELELRTLPRATSTPGLCRADFLTLDFKPVGKDEGARTRTRIDSIGAGPDYRFVEPPKAPRLDKASLAERRQTGLGCAWMDFDRDEFFYAPDEEQAVRGTWLIRSFLAQVKDGKPNFPITCGEEPCGKQAARLALRYPSIDDCAWERPSCSVRSYGEITLLEITTKPGSPAEIASAHLSEVWWHVSGYRD